MPTPENDHRCADMTGVPACHYHAVHAPQEPHTGASRLRTREPTHGAHDAASRPVARLHRRPGASVPHARAYGSVLQHCTTTAALYVCALHGSRTHGASRLGGADRSFVFNRPKPETTITYRFTCARHDSRRKCDTKLGRGTRCRRLHTRLQALALWVGDSSSPRERNKR